MTDNVGETSPHATVGDHSQRNPRSPAHGGAPAATHRSAAAAVPLGMLALLAVQFLLGMAVNLYVHLPAANAGMAQMMRGGPAVMVHMITGMILAAAGLTAVVLAIPKGHAALTWALVAFGGIVLAGVAGMIFLMAGQSNGASYPDVSRVHHRRRRLHSRDRHNQVTNRYQRPIASRRTVRVPQRRSPHQDLPETS